MRRAILKLDVFSYGPDDSDNYPMWALGMFLTTDAISGTTWQNWARDSSKIGTASNITALDKIGNNVRLFLMFDTDDFLADPEKYSLTMPLDQFIYVVDEWQRLKKERPAFIIITQQHEGKYTVVATNEQPMILQGPFLD